MKTWKQEILTKFESAVEKDGVRDFSIGAGEFSINYKIKDGEKFKAGLKRGARRRVFSHFERDAAWQADTAIILYGNAKRALTILERQLACPEFNAEDRNFYAGLLAELETRAALTDNPDQQTTEAFAEIKSKHDADERQRDKADRTAKAEAAARNHPLYAVLESLAASRNVEGCLLVAEFKGRGAPLLRRIQDRIGADLNLRRQRVRVLCCGFARRRPWRLGGFDMSRFYGVAEWDSEKWERLAFDVAKIGLEFSQKTTTPREKAA